MVRTGARRRLAFGLIAALLVNAALLALMAPRGRDVGWPAGADTGVALRLELTREPAKHVEVEPVSSAVRRQPKQAPLSPEASKPPSASARALATPTPGGQGVQAGLPSPSLAQGAQAGGVQGDSVQDADLRAKTALALRKLGACSRVNSGAGDAQDKELCTHNFAAADAATIDTIPIGKRADYDVAHAKAGYLVPADAASPNFVTSQFKRGGTVWTIHAGCALVQGKWQCGVH